MLIKAVSSLLPEVYGERVQHDVTVGGVVRLGAPAAAPKPIAEADFTMLAETPEQVKPPANILAVAAAPASVAEYECQFGGKRLVEATLFYDADGKLQPPQPNVLVVEESELDRAYTAAGIPHRVSTAQFLIRSRLLQSVSVQACAVDVGAGARTGSGLTIPQSKPAATGKHAHAGAAVEGSEDADR